MYVANFNRQIHKNLCQTVKSKEGNFASKTAMQLVDNVPDACAPNNLLLIVVIVNYLLPYVFVYSLVPNIRLQFCFVNYFLRKLFADCFFDGNDLQ